MANGKVTQALETSGRNGTKAHPLLRGQLPTSTGKFDVAIAGMLRSLAMYADDHAAEYGSTIGEDRVLGAEWRQALSAVRGMLNGELGRLDGGDTDRAILAMYTAAGFDGDEP